MQREVVLEDIRRQVVAGAQHITFGDPDFFNGPTHAMRIVESLHREFPALTYDVTIKIEHLLEASRRACRAARYRLPVRHQRGGVGGRCRAAAASRSIIPARISSEMVALFREAGLLLNPTFIAFLPWTTRAGYLELLTRHRANWT